MEIPDALKLLELDLQGRIVTGDAMFCQKSIVAKIVGRGATTSCRSRTIKRTCGRISKRLSTSRFSPLVSFESDCEKTHGRIERRSIDVLPARAAGIEKDWPSVQHICTIYMDGTWMAAEEIARGRLDKANADCSSAAQRMKSAKLWWGRLKPGGGMDFGSLLTWGMR
jgi:predicted transposase YbfD/YdcC